MIKNIIVTGGAGYLGCRVVYDLAKEYPSTKIWILDNFSRGRVEAIGEVKNQFPEERVEIIPWENADIRDYEKIEEIFDKIRPEIVIHLAAIVDAFSTNRAGKDEECRIVNYESSVKLAEIAKKYQTRIFINQSSASVYSRGENIKEDYPKDPLSTYGYTKLRAEESICKLNDRNFKVCSLRDATLIGYTPGFTYQTIINICCMRGLYDIPIRIFESALEGNKTYLDVKDASSSIIFVINNIEKMNGEVYNVSSFNTPLKEVLACLENYLKKKVKCMVVKEKRINQTVYTISSDKIKKLGFKPVGKLDSIIKDTIESLIKRKDCYKWQPI